ncbi:MAG: pyruvate formate-lyase [Clostridia bacterium]|nr:pyruvate formate-lyase [Clostridia bacterium]
MEERVKKIYERLQKREYRNLRRVEDVALSNDCKQISDLALRSARRLYELVAQEQAVLFEEDRIGMMRTITSVPPLLQEEEQKALYLGRFVFDSAQVGNISSDYEGILADGFLKKRALLSVQKEKYATDSKQFKELEAMNVCIDAILLLAEKYRAEAEKMGNTRLAEALKRVPMYAPNGYYEALVMMRMINFTLWLNANKHNTLGRFDEYMYPYFLKDVERGSITREEALALTQEFFIDLNFDADLYPGVQQGDNGQSLVLGGVNADGDPVWNELSELCLEASLSLNLIDPKINIRVSKETPFSVYEKGTLLTKQGLGFPQYSNDDVVIPALCKMGYDLCDARNYVVAACWEFIIPGVAYEIPNVDALNYPGIVLDVIKEKLVGVHSFDELLSEVKARIQSVCFSLAEGTKNIFVEPSPFQSIVMTDCIERAQDISEGAKYNNYGFHGAGLSTAADSLAAVKKLVFEEKAVTAQELICALDNDFNGYGNLRAQCLACPKMGNNDDFVDGIAVALTDCFADSLAGLKNERGGIFRAGTGSAMYYIWYSEKLGATPDGRKKGEPFSANYSPSLNVKFDGVLSVIHSFTKPHLERVCNGGPLTLEFHDTLFRNEEGTQKVARLVKLFVENGGHQLQLNAINRETLLDAQKHPEDHKNLIVRVWGWSGYFNELDLEYQNHIIKRIEFLS